MERSREGEAVLVEDPSRGEDVHAVLKQRADDGHAVLKQRAGHVLAVLKQRSRRPPTGTEVPFDTNVLCQRCAC